MDNVVLPLIIFWGMLGFEVLAEKTENPLGHDSTDLNLLEVVHALDASAQYAFEISEMHRNPLQRALLQPLHDFQMSASSRTVPSERAGGNEKRVPANDFSTYFQWMPIPTLVLADVMESHGHVDIVHNSHFSHGGKGLRGLLRDSLRRGPRASAFSHQATPDDPKPADSSSRRVQACQKESKPVSPSRPMRRSTMIRTRSAITSPLLELALRTSNRF